MEFKEISSTQNPLVKEILLLKEKSRARKKSGTFVIEGLREIFLALKGSYKLKKVLICEAIFGAGQEDLFKLEGVETIKISKQVYRKISHRESTEGIIALATSKNLDLKALKLNKENPLILVAEAPEKPGNIGALLRTADAANLDAVIIANPKTDMYNPNIIRSSVGCLFTSKIATGSTKEVIDYLQANQIKIYCAALNAARSYEEVDFSPGTAIVVGTEASGLSTDWLEASEENILIEMEGQIDSLNVSVSAAVIIFEAKRQRKNEKN